MHCVVHRLFSYSLNIPSFLFFIFSFFFFQVVMTIKFLNMDGRLIHFSSQFDVFLFLKIMGGNSHHWPGSKHALASLIYFKSRCFKTLRITSKYCYSTRLTKMCSFPAALFSQKTGLFSQKILKLFPSVSRYMMISGLD